MISDVYTVFWKEWKELFKQRGLRGGFASWLIMVALVGIFMPLNFGRDWLTNPIMLISWSWPPLLSVMSLVTDAFAGERERHTLETLLASRLSDRAILFGKILTMVVYGWSMQLAATLLSAITVNVIFFTGSLRFYSAGLLFGVLAFSLVALLLVSALGVLVSLHAPTVRAAYQKLSIGFIVIWMAIFFVPMLVPESTRQALLSQVLGISWWQVGLVVALLLILVDVLLIRLALARFQRNTLILD